MPLKKTKSMASLVVDWKANMLQTTAEVRMLNAGL